MDLALVYIGIGESILASIFIFLKNPLRVVDKILGIWIILILCFFSGNVVMIQHDATDIWPLTVNIFLAFSPIMFLYAKYIVSEYEKFKRMDYLHFLPAILGIIFISIYLNSNLKDIKTILAYYNDEQTTLRSIFGWLYILSLWVYVILALVTVKRYQKQITNYYSYESGKINLRWLYIVIISYFLFSNFSLVISVIHYGVRNIPHIEKFRSGVFVVFINVISIWGYRQRQLLSNVVPPKLAPGLGSETNDSDKYKHSGLKKQKAEECFQKLVDLMDNSEIWKDNELSVDKISVEINIPKYFVSQVLNEKIKKNFYTFINEYRVEYAMKLIKSPKYESWSFVAIAFESGFNSKSAFNNFFKKYTGMTPSEFKNANN